MSDDYRKLGLKVGLEVHQQLNTKHKLFCQCPTELDEKVGNSLERYLKPVMSELGEIDVAAYFEWEKGKKFVYDVPLNSSCLVECDEEPPHPMNLEAIMIGLAITIALHGNPVDEVLVMRKTVIDGSNTSGFQRTAIVGLGGYLDDVEGRISIQTIAIEEDAARKIEELKDTVRYNLDRLGIPLIEISTGPDISSPEQAKRVALEIGQMLRLTGKVKRGLGTIRQDLNVSISGGVKTEIKGVQDLDLIPKIIENEAKRQRSLLEIREALRSRLDKETFLENFMFKELTDLFRETKSRVILSELNRGGQVIGIKAPGFAGILGKEVMPGRRFGTEVSDYVKSLAGLGGIFHSDELPNYGITETEISKVRETLGIHERDAFILIVGQREKLEKAVSVIRDRLAHAFEGVPKETRAANEDGTSKFMRPQPGSARMYPETDIPSIRITTDLLREAETIAPPTPEEKLDSLLKLGLNEELAKQVLNSPRLELFEKLVTKFGQKVPPTLIASTLENTLKYVKSQGGDINRVTDSVIEKILEEVYEGRISKDSIPSILLDYCSPEENRNLREIIVKYTQLSDDELLAIISAVVKESEQELRVKGEKAFGIVMGRVMDKVRGRAEGRRVAELIRRVLKEKSG